MMENTRAHIAIPEFFSSGSDRPVVVAVMGSIVTTVVEFASCGWEVYTS